MNECVIVILSKYYLIKRETKVFGLVFSHLSFLSASWISLHHFVSLLLLHFFFYADLYNFQLFLLCNHHRSLSDPFFLGVCGVMIIIIPHYCFSIPSFYLIR